MKNEQVELGGITFIDKTRGGGEKKVNAGEIVVDIIAEKREKQEEFEKERRNNWKKFKQETAEIDPDLLKKTDEELVAEKYGLNPDGTKREERKDMPNSHKKIDAKKFKKGGEVGGRRDASDKFNESNKPNEFSESEHPLAETEAGAERQAEEKIENPGLAKKINRMAKLSGESWDLFKRLEDTKKEISEPELSLGGNDEQKKQLRKKKDEINKIYDDINKISQELVILYYRDIKKEMDDPNIVYKIEGIGEDDAKRARGAIGRIEEGKTYIKIGHMEINNGDLEKLLDIDKKMELNETVKMANKTISNWGEDKILLRIGEGQEPEYLVKFFDPERGDVKLETGGGKKVELRTLYLYAVNFDKANKEIKAKKENGAEKVSSGKPETKIDEKEERKPNPFLTEKINELADLFEKRGIEYKNLEDAKRNRDKQKIEDTREKMNLLTRGMMISYYRDIKEKIDADNLEKNFGENGKKAKEAIETINKIEPEDISRQSFEKLAEIKDKRKEEEILTAIKDRKTLLRIKENTKREYVLVTYNPGAEYSYVETQEGKNRQRVRSKDVYALNADVIDNIEKAGTEVAK